MKQPNDGWVATSREVRYDGAMFLNVMGMRCLSRKHEDDRLEVTCTSAGFYASVNVGSQIQNTMWVGS